MTPTLSLFYRLQVSILVFLLLLSCAGQVPPAGGPVDTTPPEIISTYPQNYSTGFHENKIEIEFDKYVDRRSVEESIFISPFVGRLEYDWSGKEVEIKFSEMLRENTTYVVNIGTDVVDIHNKNRMAQSFTLAFATGKTIDRGVIRGKVHPRKAADSPSGVMIFAYKLEGLNEDTLNPRTTMPEYVTQTGKGGEFELRHVALAPYRLLAVRDEFRNLLYDPETDEYGVPSFPLILTDKDTIATTVLMQLAKEDTTAPRLIRVTAQNRRHLLIQFSEPTDTSSVVARHFRIADTLNGKPLGVLSVSRDIVKEEEIVLVTDEQQADIGYRLHVDRVRDLAGLSISPLANSLTFAGSSLPDTAAPRISSISVRDSARGISFQPELQIAFSKPIRRVDSDGIFSLEDASKNSIPNLIRWIGNSAVEIRPQKQLAPKTWYVLQIAGQTLQDFSGNAAKDSSRRIWFETIDPEVLSAIEGTVVDQNETDTTGGFVLQAQNVSQKDSKPYVVYLEKAGTFLFADVVEGRYALKAFRDRNGNRIYDPGLPIPYHLSERFTVYRDTLKVRARWPLEGVKVELR